MKSDLTLLLPEQYIKDASQTIRKATTRVCLLSLVFADQSKTHELIVALEDAAKRNLRVDIAADIFTYGEIGGFLRVGKDRTAKTKQVKNTVKHLVKSGAKFQWLGKSHCSIFAGRTHAKWCIVDDTVYIFGGVNIHNNGVTNNDYMFKVIDKDLADTLCHEFKSLVRADKLDRPRGNKSLNWRDNKILIDGGKVNSSIIYHRACKLAAEAKKIVLVSQYCPTGKLNKLLHQTDSKIYFNDYTCATGPNRIAIHSGMIATRNQTSYKKPQYLHAKFIVFENSDGAKTAITGSHNFVKAGVVFGTNEIALETRDPKIIQQLEQFLVEHVI